MSGWAFNEFLETSASPFFLTRAGTRIAPRVMASHGIMVTVEDIGDAAPESRKTDYSFVHQNEAVLMLLVDC